MSVAKRILFDDDPAYNGIREGWRDVAAKRVASFPFPIQTKRKNRLGRGPYWDPFWKPAVREALNNLGVEAIIVNERYHIRTSAQASAVSDLAESIHKQRIAEWAHEA